jgi:hypothetical protein
MNEEDDERKKSNEPKEQAKPVLQPVADPMDSHRNMCRLRI